MVGINEEFIVRVVLVTKNLLQTQVTILRNFETSKLILDDQVVFP